MQPAYRIAVFSDVHGNLPALESLLKAIDASHPDTILCLGDLVDFAPWPNEVIEIIRSRNICTVMGNHDERIANGLEVFPLEKHEPEERLARVRAIEWSRSAVTAANKSFLASLPRSMKLSFGPLERSLGIQFVHASPRSLDEYIYERHSEEDVRSMLLSTSSDVLVMGHTHTPYTRTLAGGAGLLVNVGSVGRSKEPSREPSFAMLTLSDAGVETEIHRVAYDRDRTIAAIRESSIPDFYADFLMDASACSPPHSW